MPSWVVEPSNMVKCIYPVTPALGKPLVINPVTIVAAINAKITAPRNG